MATTKRMGPKEGFTKRSGPEGLTKRSATGEDDVEGHSFSKRSGPEGLTKRMGPGEGFTKRSNQSD